MSSSYKANYQVFRNAVTQYGADNTGQTDASAKIQAAINGKHSEWRGDLTNYKQLVRATVVLPGTATRWEQLGSPLWSISRPEHT